MLDSLILAYTCMLNLDTQFANNPSYPNHIAVNQAQRTYYAILSRYIRSNTPAIHQPQYATYRRAINLETRARKNLQRIRILHNNTHSHNTHIQTLLDIASAQVTRANQNRMRVNLNVTWEATNAPAPAPSNAPKPKQRVRHPITRRYYTPP